jgi:hypothetical protein
MLFLQFERSFNRVGEDRKGACAGILDELGSQDKERALAFGIAEAQAGEGRLDTQIFG